MVRAVGKSKKKPGEKKPRRAPKKMKPLMRAIGPSQPVIPVNLYSPANQIAFDEHETQQLILELGVVFDE